MEQAIAMSRSADSHLIFSVAYSGYKGIGEREEQLRREMVVNASVKDFTVITGINNTFEETLKTARIVEGLGFKNLLIVAEKHHLPRVKKCFEILAPSIDLYWMSVDGKGKFEVTRESSVLKSVRMGFEALWVLWNLVVYPLIPFFLSRFQKRNS